MKTKYLNNEIELLNSIKKNNELSDYGKEKLNEFNKIKEQLNLSGVVGQSEHLNFCMHNLDLTGKCFKCGEQYIRKEGDLKI